MNIWKDPDRWVDADMSYDEWVIYLKHKALWALALAFTITTIAVLTGVIIHG